MTCKPVREAFLASCAALLGIASTPVLADEADWVGHYIGLDAVDGSIDHLSITPIGDGILEIRIVIPKAGYCDGDAGVVVRRGRLIDDRLQTEDGSLICDGTEPRSLPGITYTRDDTTGFLSVEVTEHGRTLYYHPVGAN